MYCHEVNTGFDVFRSKKSDLKFSRSNWCGSYVFWTINMPNIDEKHSKGPILHVKHKNTRKTGTKMVANTLFSQIDKILKIYPRLDEYIWFPFFPGSRIDFKLPYGHILFWSKGDQNYYTSNILSKPEDRLVINYLFITLEFFLV